MTPLKATPKEVRQYKRNLGAPSGPSLRDEHLVSLLHRMFWRNFSAITGKSYSLHEIHNDARVRMIRDRFVKEYLPELRRKLK